MPIVFSFLATGPSCIAKMCAKEKFAGGSQAVSLMLGKKWVYGFVIKLLTARGHICDWKLWRIES